MFDKKLSECKDPDEIIRWCNANKVDVKKFLDPGEFPHNNIPPEPIISELTEDYFQEAYMSNEIRNGREKQPVVNHSDRHDYAYSREDEIHARLRFLKEERKQAEKEVAYYVRDLFNHYNTWSESMLCEAQRILSRIDRDIKYNRSRLKYKEDQEKESYDIAHCKQVAMDRITTILPSGFFLNNPFREEHSPSNSLHVDRKTNRFKDFGSGKTGDAIDVFMAVNNCSMIEALKELSKM